MQPAHLLHWQRRQRSRTSVPGERHSRDVASPRGEAHGGLKEPPHPRVGCRAALVIGGGGRVARQSPAWTVRRREVARCSSQHSVRVAMPSVATCRIYRPHGSARHQRNRRYKGGAFDRCARYRLPVAATAALPIAGTAAPHATTRTAALFPALAEVIVRSHRRTVGVVPSAQAQRESAGVHGHRRSRACPSPGTDLLWFPCSSVCDLVDVPAGVGPSRHPP